MNITEGEVYQHKNSSVWYKVVSTHLKIKVDDKWEPAVMYQRPGGAPAYVRSKEEFKRKFQVVKIGKE